MSRARLVLVISLVSFLSAAAPASADHERFNFKRMDMLFSSPNPTGATNSDLAFFRNRAYAGTYDGIRIFDISDPDEPELVTEFSCPGAQNDLSVWDMNRDRRPDLLVASVDRTLSGPECGATPVEHDDPNGWEGLRIFRLNGDQITQEGAVYQDCGSHTHTGYFWGARDRVRILNSSYPLRPGPTCGPVRGPEAGRDPAHGVIQVVDIRRNYEGAEIAELPIDYENDPAKPCLPVACEANAFYALSERGLAAPGTPGLVEPLRACHDMTVNIPRRRVAAACAEEVQLWRLGRDGLPDTEDPLWTYDQDNVDFWHSATFSWDGKVVNAIDESFGSGCPTTTQLPAGNGGQLVESGNMFFLRTSDGAKLSEFRYPRSTPDEHEHEHVSNYCSAHLGIPVPMPGRNLLVNAWYTGGVNVVDFSDPRNPFEVAYWDVNGDNWAAYWYEFRPDVARGFDIYASHGVEGAGAALRGGFQKYRANIAGNRLGLSFLNPQTQLHQIRGPSYADRRAARRAAKVANRRAAAKRALTGGAVAAPTARGADHLAP